MSVLSSPQFLRNVLLADAITGLGSGVLQLLFTGTMASMLGLPAGLLTATGVFLLAFAAALAFLATRQPIPRAPVWIVVVGNMGWAVGCVVLLASGVFPVTALGMAYLLVHAVTVFVMAELEWMGLRRAAAGRA